MPQPESVQDAPIKVGLVERVELVRRGLEEMVRSVAFASLIFSTVDIAGAERYVSRFPPDVLIVSSAISPAEASAVLSIAPREMQVLTLVRGAGSDHISAALRLPTKVFLMEDELVPEMLATGLHAAHAKQSLIARPVGEHLLTEARRALGARVPLRQPGPLTRREHEVLTLLADGLATKQIAKELTLSGHTVKRYIANVFTKLESTNRAMAVSQAIARGLIEPACTVGRFGN